MPMISRAVGTVSTNISVFIPDATVSTGAGLANIVASTVTLGWYRSDMSAVSSWTLTSGTLGTWTNSTFTQANSTVARGWYQVSLPHGLFAGGHYAAAHLSGPASMAPVPLIIELTRDDNQQYVSSKVYSSTSIVARVTAPVGVSTITVGVNASTVSDKTGYSVSALTTPVTASSVTAGINVTSFRGTAAVTSAAGVLSVGVSTAVNLGSPVTVSSGVVRVSSSAIPFGVSSVATPVTVSSGVVRVSSSAIPFGVSSLSASALTNFFDTGAVFFSTAVVSSVAYEIATNATIGGAVGVSSISIPVGVSSIATPVTVSSGVISVSSLTIPVGVSSIATPVTVSTVSDKAGYSVSTMTAGVNEAVADAFLNRNVSTGGNGTRPVKEALYVLRNKVDAGLGIVYQTDDTTSSWSFSVSTQASDPIVSITPN